MIRMNVSQKSLETGVGLEETVKKIIRYQVFWKDAIGKNIKLIDLQYKLYNSDGYEFFGKLEISSLTLNFISLVENGTINLDDFSFSTEK